MRKITYFLFAFVFTNFLNAQTCINNSNSLTFNGTSAYGDLTTATAFFPDSAITVEAWIKPTAFGTASWNSAIVGKDGWTAAGGEGGFDLRCGGNGILSFVISAKTFSGTIATPSSWREAISPAGSLPLNTWTHVAGTYDGANIKCFVNGIEVASTPYVGMINKGNLYATKVARCPETSSARYFNGSIDEVRIWERALTATEILNNKDNHIDPTIQSRLTGYWRFNNGSGTTATDFGPLSSTCNLFGATWNTSVPFVGAVNSSSIAGQSSVTPMVNYDYSVTNHPGSIYNWFATNGTIVSGQNNDTVSVMWNGAGAGQLLMIETNGQCVDSSLISVTVTSVGINVNEKNSSISIYPNPAKENLSFNFSKNSFKLIQCVNLLGDVYFEESINNKNTLHLNVSNWPKGIYIYRLINNDDSIKTGKLVLE